MAASTITTPARTGRRRTITSPQAVDLLHQAQAGSSDAFAELFRLYHGLIARYVRVRARDRDAVDDLVQDTFADALTMLAIADDDVVAAYAYNRHLWANRGHLRAAYELHAQPLVTAAPTPDLQRVNLLAALLAAAPLTDDQRQALRLRLAGYPRDVAAAQMDRSRHAVRCLEWDAVRRLRSTAGGVL